MRKPFVPFELERLLSIWENQVAYNLSESGVHPMTVEELVQDPQLLAELHATELNYPQSNGSLELRQRIAALYPGATADNVLVTVGCAQANFTALMTVLEPGDEMVMMLPNYMQIWGIAHNFGFPLKSFTLKEERDWAVDLDELDRTVSSRTRLIAVVNPNNPTGHILTPSEMDAIVAAARRAGAWLLADEVYAGAERVTDQITPTFWGRYERVLATNGLSKAYGLPGLRVGWVVAPADTVQQLWARQDYFTICTTMLGNKLAAHALSPEVRPRVLQRTRDYIRSGYANFEDWCGRHGQLVSLVPPQAAAIAFIRYHRAINSTELVKRLIKTDAFVAPGDLFGMDHFLRISFGLPADYLKQGLDRLSQVLEAVED